MIFHRFQLVGVGVEINIPWIWSDLNRIQKNSSVGKMVKYLITSVILFVIANSLIKSLWVAFCWWCGVVLIMCL